MRNLENTREFITRCGNYMRSIAVGGVLRIVAVPPGDSKEFEGHFFALHDEWERILQIGDTNQNRPDVETFLAEDASWASATNQFLQALQSMQKFIADGKLGKRNGHLTKMHIEALDKLIPRAKWYAEGADPMTYPVSPERN